MEGVMALRSGQATTSRPGGMSKTSSGMPKPSRRAARQDRANVESTRANDQTRFLVLETRNRTRFREAERVFLLHHGENRRRLVGGRADAHKKSRRPMLHGRLPACSKLLESA